MKKFFALVAVMTLCAVSTFAQYINSTANANISVNVAQNANIVFDSWSADGGIGTGPAAGGSYWVVVGQSKTTNYATFDITGEGSATLDIKLNVTTSSGAVSLSSTGISVADDNAFAVNNAVMTNNTNTNRTFPGTAGTGTKHQWLRGKTTVTGVTASGSSTINFDATISNYSI